MTPEWDRITRPKNDVVTTLADDYESAEADYLEALRTAAEPRQLAAASGRASNAARDWAAAAYQEFFAMREALGANSREVVEQEIQAEKAELLQELWRTFHRRTLQRSKDVLASRTSPVLCASVLSPEPRPP